jgi:hypothetical protein
VLTQYLCALQFARSIEQFTSVAADAMLPLYLQHILFSARNKYNTPSLFRFTLCYYIFAYNTFILERKPQLAGLQHRAARSWSFLLRSGVCNSTEPQKRDRRFLIFLFQGVSWASKGNMNASALTKHKFVGTRKICNYVRNRSWEFCRCPNRNADRNMSWFYREKRKGLFFDDRCFESNQVSNVDEWTLSDTM